MMELQKFGMEINGEKPKIMTNNGTLQRWITIQGQKLQTIDHFKYHGAIICDEASRREVFSKTARTMVALSRLNPFGKTRTSEKNAK